MASFGRAAIGRRAFIHGLSLVTSALVAGGWTGAAAPLGVGASPLSRGVRAIGETYLAMHPPEASRERLRASVPADPAELRRRVRGDFERGEVVSVRGWLLSRTECRACALAVLTGTGPGA
jgi:hypothetical protein